MQNNEKILVWPELILGPWEPENQSCALLVRFQKKQKNKKSLHLGWDHLAENRSSFICSGIDIAPGPINFVNG